MSQRPRQLIAHAIYKTMTLGDNLDSMTHFLEKALLEVEAEAYRRGAERMRAQCAAAADEWGYSSKPDHALGIARAIRALRIPDDVSG